MILLMSGVQEEKIVNLKFVVFLFFWIIIMFNVLIVLLSMLGIGK